MMTYIIISSIAFLAIYTYLTIHESDLDMISNIVISLFCGGAIFMICVLWQFAVVVIIVGSILYLIDKVLRPKRSGKE